MGPMRDESGFTLPELLIYLTILLIVMGGLVSMISSGLKANANATAILASQSNVLVAVNRIEFEARCASSASLVSGGAAVTLTLPSYCINASGTYTWCVAGGTLVKHTGTSCTGTGQTYASSVTSATPFSCITGGLYPRLQVALTSNAGTTSGTGSTGTTTITLRNATSPTGCA
jgi:Tfp pilus assembly protein PilW